MEENSELIADLFFDNFRKMIEDFKKENPHVELPNSEGHIKKLEEVCLQTSSKIETFHFSDQCGQIFTHIQFEIFGGFTATGSQKFIHSIRISLWPQRYRFFIEILYTDCTSSFSLIDLKNPSSSWSLDKDTNEIPYLSPFVWGDSKIWNDIDAFSSCVIPTQKDF